MFDAPHFPPRLERSTGSASVEIARAGDRSRLRDLYQAGSAKVFLPRVHADRPEVVFLNTSGGLTGGDRLDYCLSLGPGAQAVATTQTAERVYANGGGVARIGVTLSVGSGALLHWVPQETILFDNAAVMRRTQADLSGDACFLMSEMIVLGRAAMGEAVRALDLTDHREVRRDGVPVLIEPLRFTEDTLAPRPSLLGGARAIATLALIAPGAEDALGAVRAELVGCDGVIAAASAWDGKCVMRCMATDAMPLRVAVARVLRRIGGGALPRVWQE